MCGVAWGNFSLLDSLFLSFFLLNKLTSSSDSPYWKETLSRKTTMKRRKRKKERYGRKRYEKKKEEKKEILVESSISYNSGILQACKTSLMWTALRSTPS